MSFYLCIPHWSVPCFVFQLWSCQVSYIEAEGKMKSHIILIAALVFLTMLDIGWVNTHLTELLRMTVGDFWMTASPLTIRFMIFHWKLPPEWYRQINRHWNLLQRSASKRAWKKHPRADGGFFFGGGGVVNIDQSTLNFWSKFPFKSEVFRSAQRSGLGKSYLKH